MKYMGSKLSMLRNGLGDILRREGRDRERVVDLFSGSGSVSWFAAQELRCPVLAIDLQQYAAVLARAVVERTAVVDSRTVWEEWSNLALSHLKSSHIWQKAKSLDDAGWNTPTWCRRARLLCSETATPAGPIWTSYGGYYFSPTQALTLDALLSSLPEEEPVRSVCMASLITAASQCAASPGHTAQPFKPTRTAGPYLRQSWLRDVLKCVKTGIDSISLQHASVPGEARVGNAVNEARHLSKGDLVFVDPPYSGVHYSRFYHVLETIARGECGPVAGSGRYPPPDERPASSFSRKGESPAALRDLFDALAEAGCTVILTFPAARCSNGLSGAHVAEAAALRFNLQKTVVCTRFSTLGGNGTHRRARKLAREMILLMRAK